MQTELVKDVYNGLILSKENSTQLFNSIFQGEVQEVQLAALLMAFKTRKETAEEIAGAALSMRNHALSPGIEAAAVFDTCGTGGDNSYSFNISTAVAIILSAMGHPIAKHGNRSVSSASGSADFLEALGVPININPDQAREYFKQHNFLFLFAPLYHPAMKYAMPVRKQLGIRTIFNYLGPLTNPAAPKRQMIGVFSPDFLPLYAEAAKRLPFQRVVLYSAENGMDEISPLHPTIIYDVRDKKIHMFTIHPAEFLTREEAQRIPSGMNAQENAAIFIKTITTASSTPLAKLLALNTALALYTLDGYKDISTAHDAALRFILSGRVMEKVNALQGKA